MRKSELVENIALRTGLPKSEAASALETITETIASALEQGDDVQLAGFGRFSVARRAARVGRNPATGETIQIRPSRVATFRPSQQLRRALASEGSGGLAGDGDTDYY
jgi:DNA-binding protein HU-beta